MTGYESFDVVLHLNTTDTQIAREIVGDAGEKIKDRDDWDGKLLFETIWEGSPEIEMRVRVYLTSEARQNGSGAELYF
ncbi:hypothetical protein Hbor_29220 [Halogeometricum borinquense DSM 11551]|nr:hypothetical protein Hbor_29220 [Halogeometricum borinquense DSM 11551]